MITQHSTPTCTSIITLSDEEVTSLERATLDAVAPPEVREIKDWLLPFDRSTIGRAKSAVPLRHQGLSADALDARSGVSRLGHRPEVSRG